jgi:hypothetical protein
VCVVACTDLAGWVCTARTTVCSSLTECRTPLPSAPLSPPRHTAGPQHHASLFSSARPRRPLCTALRLAASLSGLVCVSHQLRWQRAFELVLTGTGCEQQQLLVLDAWCVATSSSLRGSGQVQSVGQVHSVGCPAGVLLDTLLLRTPRQACSVFVCGDSDRCFRHGSVVCAQWWFVFSPQQQPELEHTAASKGEHAGGGCRRGRCWLLLLIAWWRSQGFVFAGDRLVTTSASRELCRAGKHASTSRGEDGGVLLAMGCCGRCVSSAGCVLWRVCLIVTVCAGGPHKERPSLSTQASRVSGLAQVSLSCSKGQARVGADQRERPHTLLQARRVCLM